MTTRAAIAFHEAGHAVMTVYCRMGLGTVSIIPANDFQGVCKTMKQPSLSKRDYSLTTKAESRLNHRIMIAVAGDVAQRLFSRRRDPSYSTSSDHALSLEMAGRTCGDLEETIALVNYLTISARNILRTPIQWDAVKALAKELLEKNSVSGKRAKEIIQNA